MSYLSRRMREEKRWSGVRGALARERAEALSGLDDLQRAMVRDLRRPVQRELERRFIGDITRLRAEFRNQYTRPGVLGFSPYVTLSSAV